MLCVTLLSSWRPVVADEHHPRGENESHLDRFIDDNGIGLLFGIAGAYTASGGRARDAGRQSLDAMIVTGAVTELLKRQTRQGRPCDPAATDGFPSAHTSLAFALATAAGHHRPEDRWPLYAFAALYTSSRLRTDAHTPEQVLAGAALGYGIGRWSVSADGIVGHVFVRPSGPQQLSGDPARWDPRWDIELWRAEW